MIPVTNVCDHRIQSFSECVARLTDGAQGHDRWGACDLGEKSCSQWNLGYSSHLLCHRCHSHTGSKWIFHSRCCFWDKWHKWQQLAQKCDLSSVSLWNTFLCASHRAQLLGSETKTPLWTPPLNPGIFTVSDRFGPLIKNFAKKNQLLPWMLFLTQNDFIVHERCVWHLPQIRCQKGLNSQSVFGTTPVDQWGQAGHRRGCCRPVTNVTHSCLKGMLVY